MENQNMQRAGLDDAWDTDDWELPTVQHDERLDAYDQLFVLNPKVDMLARRMLELVARTDGTLARNAATAANWGTRGAKLDELTLLPIFGPSGAGKSKTIQFVTNKIHQRRAARDKRPVLVATLRAARNTTSDLQASILEAFRDPSARFVRKRIDYSETEVNAGISAIARKRATRVVVLDEAHNALAAAGPDEVATALKSILNDGVFSIVLAGTDKIAPIFAHEELRQRCEDPLDFSPPTISDYQGCLEFFRSTERLCEQIYDRRIVQAPFRPLRRPEQCALFYEMSDGNFGRVVRIIRRGLKRTFELGRSTLEWSVLIDAHNNWMALEAIASSSAKQTKFVGSDARPKTVAMVEKLARMRPSAP